MFSASVQRIKLAVTTRDSLWMLNRASLWQCLQGAACIVVVVVSERRTRSNFGTSNFGFCAKTRTAELSFRFMFVNIEIKIKII